MVPKDFVIIASQKTREKVKLCNTMLYDWQAEFKRSRTQRRARNVHTMPQTHKMQTFGHSIDYTEHNFKDWKGYLDGVLEEVCGQ